jgi:epsilon-lactone hydrolase
MIDPSVFNIEAHVLAFSKRLAEATALADARRAFETYPIESLPVADTVTVINEDPSCMWIGDPRHGTWRRGVYLHGGGYVAGNVRMYADLVSRLAVETGSWIFVPDIPLAPERQFPAAHDAAIAACRYSASNTPSAREAATSVFLAGDSFGAALALATGMRLRDEGESELLTAILGFSPTLDMTAAGEWYIRCEPTDRIVSKELTKQCIAMYAPDANPNHPTLSPIHGRCWGLPSVLLQGSEDAATCESSLLAASLARKQGHLLEVRTWKGLPHVWRLLAPQLLEATIAIQCAGEFISKVLGDED